MKDDKDGGQCPPYGTMVTSSDQVYCYHFNAIGSTIAMTDSSQTMVNKYAYDPFGKVTNQEEAIAQPFKFVGQYGVMTEPNGFYYMRARYYDPQVGRFISEDPIGFEGGDVNLYAYVGNNPVTLIDPNGQLAFFWHFGITFVAARNSGYGIWDSAKLAWKAMAVDFASGSQGQNPEATRQHAMASPGQSRAQAISATNAYIQSSINSDNIAGAVHAAQDLATPQHNGRPWTGFTAAHVIGDVFPSWSTIKQAYQNTIQVISGSYGSGYSGSSK